MPLLHMLLPAFCLSYVYLAIITRIVRSSMISVMGQDFITTVTSKWPFRGGDYPEALPEKLSHPDRDDYGPFDRGAAWRGAILTETIFNWPGMGKYVVDSVNFLDFPAIMGFTLVVSFAYVMINLLVDVLYAFLDPQIRY